MQMQLTKGWSAEVEREQEWLYLKLRWEPTSGELYPQLVQPLWQLTCQQLLNRVVLELQHIPLLHSHLVGELVQLQQRIAEQGGMLRLAGLTEDQHAVLQIASLADRFPHYRTRQEAVQGYRPKKPR